MLYYQDKDAITQHVLNQPAGMKQDEMSQFTQRMHTQASVVKAMPAQQRITQGVTQRKIAHKMTLGDSSTEVFCT